MDGRVALTPFVLPGEVARVEPEQERPDLIRTRLIEVISPSPHRYAPPCPLFYECGGCHYQHARYEFQVEQKAAILREQLRRVGRIDFTGEIETISGPPLGYRNRSQFHIERRRIGYFANGSHRLTPVDRCPISSPKINETLAILARMMRDRRFPGFIRAVELFTDEASVLLNVLDTGMPVARRFFDWCAEEIPGLVRGALNYRAAGHVFQVSHNSFFQVNRFLLDALVQAATGDAAGSSALDLYAGVGLFSLALARRFDEVTAVESAMSAVHDLKTNAERAALDIRVAHAGVEPFLAGMERSAEFVLADPPRAGLGKRVTAELVRLRPRRIHIASCDPSTLARDLAALVAGGYRITKLILLDLFPQTYHFESIAYLAAEERR
ncbi:MAG TPA: methyltransferase [Bryobacteraceae bacterium]|nr:methyltransferase [Bryobacteraceae bacterium]